MMSYRTWSPGQCSHSERCLPGEQGLVQEFIGAIRRLAGSPHQFAYLR